MAGAAIFSIATAIVGRSTNYDFLTPSILTAPLSNALSSPNRGLIRVNKVGDGSDK